MKHKKKESKTRTYIWCDFETTGIFDIRSNNDVYPIEVGIILTDDHYNIYDTYTSYIGWDHVIRKITEASNNNDDLKWPKEYQGAYKIHKIHPKDYIDKSINVLKVAHDIHSLVSSYTFNENVTKPLIISDNVQFEYRLMEYVMKDYCRKYSIDWPFHYCGYDTSEFLIRSGVGDPTGTEHSALRDAALLLKQMTIARDRINGF